MSELGDKFEAARFGLTKQAETRKLPAWVIADEIRRMEKELKGWTGDERQRGRRAEAEEYFKYKPGLVQRMAESPMVPAGLIAGAGGTLAHLTRTGPGRLQKILSGLSSSDRTSLLKGLFGSDWSKIKDLPFPDIASMVSKNTLWGRILQKLGIGRMATPMTHRLRTSIASIPKGVKTRAAKSIAARGGNYKRLMGGAIGLPLLAALLPMAGKSIYDFFTHGSTQRAEAWKKYQDQKRRMSGIAKYFPELAQAYRSGRQQGKEIIDIPQYVPEDYEPPAVAGAMPPPPDSEGPKRMYDPAIYDLPKDPWATS